MNKWSEYLSPNEPVVWESSSYTTFKTHEIHSRFMRTVQYFAPVLVAVVIALQELSTFYAVLLVAVTALAVFFFPRVERPDKPWVSFAITPKGAHSLTLGGVHTFIPWLNDPQITVSNSWTSLGGLIKAPVTVKITNNKGTPKSRTMKWTVAATEQADIRKKLAGLSLACA